MGPILGREADEPAGVRGTGTDGAPPPLGGRMPAVLV